jgi:hypothetical protein
LILIIAGVLGIVGLFSASSYIAGAITGSG